MSKSRVDSAALIGAVLAGSFSLFLMAGPFAWMGSLGAFILLLVLLTYDQEGYRSAFQSLAFAAACGYCFAVACGALFQFWGAAGEVHLGNGQWSSKWLPLSSGFATLLIWVVDRIRMSGRSSGVEQQVRPLPALRPYIPNTTPVEAPPVPVTPSYSAAAPLPVAPVEAEPDPEPARDAAYFEAPVAAASSPLPSVRLGSSPELVRPAPSPVVPKAGKETAIYVSLVGEGLNLLRSVRAEQVGRDYYRITDVMPEGEVWSFLPGQVVRCKKQNLSTGKALVAYEEAPRAQ